VTAAMKKGVGHIDSTSSWNSNRGLVGHNRGANTHFGKLKNLVVGDEITYSTVLGTRTYVVTTVKKIAANDWSYLQYTTDNRITLITCVEDQPQYRLCVQAVQIIR
jgi:LPXTG-site transpeptidase (sortase) family protein